MFISEFSAFVSDNFSLKNNKTQGVVVKIKRGDFGNVTAEVSRTHWNHNMKTRLSTSAKLD
jgi:hypothetical protein